MLSVSNDTPQAAAPDKHGPRNRASLGMGLRTRASRVGERWHWDLAAGRAARRGAVAGLRFVLLLAQNYTEL